jgi:hypothetical protein
MNMNDDQLNNLLRHADAAIPAPASNPALITQVRRRFHRGRAIRTTAATAVLLCITAATFWLAQERSDRKPPLVQRTPPSTTSTKLSAAQLAEIKREFTHQQNQAKLHEQIASALLAREKMPPPRANTPYPAMPTDPADPLAAQCERSALIMLNTGDRLARQPDAKTQATQTYRRILELFPQSRSAALARERIGA